MAAVSGFLVEHFGGQEGEFERLRGIEPRIAMRVIPVAERIVGDGDGTAHAFGHVLAGHLDMHAARMGALGTVDRKEALHLA